MYKAVFHRWFTNCVYFTVLYLIEATSADCLNFQAHPVPEMANRAPTPNEYLLTTIDTVKGLNMCMIDCEKENACMTFGYNDNTRECKLYRSPFLPEFDSTDSPGWSFYNYGSGICPVIQGFVHGRVNNTCLHFSSNEYTYTEGEAYCGSLGAVPVRLDTEDKRQALKLMLGPLTGNGRVSFRIGLVKDGHSWRWDGGGEETSTDWKNGQPDCGSCNCVAVRSNNQWRWSDYSCFALDKIICERLLS